MVFPLDDIPDGSDVFLDANVLIYGLAHQSGQCEHLLERCVRDELTGISLYEVINSVTHRLMLAEAKEKGLITRTNASDLKTKYKAVSQLTEYWRDTLRLLSLNLLLLPLEDPILRGAQVERDAAGLLTNDSMIVACMKSYGIPALASRDSDFGRVGAITVYSPTDV